MIIVKLESEITKEKKKIRSKNIKKNKGSYNKLKEMLVPKEMKLHVFRKYYHPVLSKEEKETLIKLGIDPWSLEGLKYIGDSKMVKNKK